MLNFKFIFNLRRLKMSGTEGADGYICIDDWLGLSDNRMEKFT
jgi:hypothetical protein